MMFALTTHEMSLWFKLQRTLWGYGLWHITVTVRFGDTQKPTPSRNPKLQYLVNIFHNLHNKSHEVVVQVVEKEMLPR